MVSFRWSLILVKPYFILVLRDVFLGDKSIKKNKEII